MKVTEFRKKKRNNRILQLKFSNKLLTTPTYFPAISSVGKVHNIQTLANLLIKTSYPQMLISAYDYEKFGKSVSLSIKKYSKNHFLFVDSGGYEKYWHGDKKWDFSSYEKANCKINSDFYTSFDGVFKKVKKNYTKNQFNDIIKSGSILPKSQFIPIFHSSNITKLINSIKEFLKKYPNSISFLAVREKECGVTITERAKTISMIRKFIDKEGNDQILHILGVGHPLSLALYSYAGADIFDSTDWYTSTLDIATNSLRDFSHLDLVDSPSPACQRIKDPITKTFIHNLDSYNVLMKKIQAHIKNNKLHQYLLKNKVNKKLLDKITN